MTHHVYGLDAFLLRKVLSEKHGTEKVLRKYLVLRS